ncbi:hypothetical protein O3G_MSEX005406 [Manduca sexta]|uniref:Major facilitator superfamily (MFS) profile domain-containing protein n=1 Tax=Manduca sexta TaxID=7130 RepID=A0A921YZ00_MANSE|nr:hypothetical protein O3G_MSEX005406 [Manduca sexta]
MLLSSVLMDVYGRKVAHFLVIIPGVVGWILMYFANNVLGLMIGRILGGITAGATVALGAIVIGEYSAPKYRGMFLNLKTAAVCLGGMIVHILGHFCHWRTVALYALIPSTAALIIICTWPESPAWLISKQQYERSEVTFYWLRGKTDESHKEIEMMIKAQMGNMSKQVGKQKMMDRTMEFLRKFTRKDFLKPLFIVIVGGMLLESCGRHWFPAYALQIIGEITGSKSQSFYYTLCIDVIITTSAVCSSILVKIMKRRMLLFSTGFAAFFVLMIVSTYLFLMSRDLVPNNHPWIPISLSVVYFILANLGCTPIPLALLGELYPLAHRGAGSAVSGVWLSIGLMLGLQLTPHFMVSYKVYGTFAIFGVIMGISLVILYFSLPETKDRTLQEIEDYFNFGKFMDDNMDCDDETKVKMMEKV